MIRDRSGMSVYDIFINISEMLVFWLSFVIPVPAVVFLEKKGFGKAEISVAVCIVFMIFSIVSMYIGTMYSGEYKQKLGYSMTVFEQQEK